MAVALSAAIILGQPIQVFAHTSSIKGQLENNKTKYEALQKKVSALEEDIFQLNDDITAAKVAITANNNEIKALESSISETEAAIEESQEALDRKQVLYDNRMRQFYKRGGQTSYLSVLLGSTGITDFISNLKTVSKLMELDNDIINSYREQQDSLNELLGQLDKSASQAMAIRSENENKLQVLKEKKEEQDSILTTLVSQAHELERLIETQEYTLVQEEKPKEDNLQNSSSQSPVISAGEGLTSLGIFKLTGYCPCAKCCGVNHSGHTSTGAIPKANHTISVDPSFIPYGTVLLINGNEYVAEDRGGGVKKYHIDIFFNTHAEALAFGVKYAEVFVNK